MSMTKEQIKSALIESGFKIFDIFSEDEITESEPAKKARKETEVSITRRLGDKINELVVENGGLQTKITKLQGDNSILAEKSNIVTVKETLAGIATERKLDPKFTAFTEKNLRNFKSTKTGDEFKSELEKFVDVTAKDYVEMGKIYGFEAKVTTEPKKPGEAGAGDGAGAPAADGAGAGNGDGQGSSDLEDPAKNDFIPA